ncbi:right-handed parallel beta-helix repeat-containing protein [Methylobacterium organophilum]|uniref:right-handed parallel beta-helix repeat-containing protein n=1 Tax=Methylobacterium organophilum TaxID=410 RepID=UPI001F146350|nr:right-handed parallel beta-helix repeat-containing protein [Methylobacterium organophilum]UMY16691.1 right-handed parallel beta-helix repeat-containing protein [Methylobacterium organophilum]
MAMLLRAAATALGLSMAGPAAACALPSGADRQNVDVAPILSDCIRKTPKGGTVELPSGTYLIKTQLVVDQPVTLKTRPGPNGTVDCRTDASRCAVIQISPQIALAGDGLPIRVTAGNVSFDGIAIKGFMNKDRNATRAICSDRSRKRLGGGLRIDADNFTIQRSSISEISCYSALEVLGLKSGLNVTGNYIGSNGNHGEKGLWADGLTIRDASNVIVDSNTFRDNTDVQLILGGCQKCSIKENNLSHSRDIRGASFAELMIHAWPQTSGRYGGSTVKDNTIDCGPAKLCGFGLMIGSNPWYKAQVSGGTIMNNAISNARVGINVDGATGMIDVRDNTVTNSGGQFSSSCGITHWPSVNVAPGSRAFIADKRSIPPEPGIDSSSCLIDIN